MLINFDSEHTEIILNPRMPEVELGLANRILPKSGELIGHIWLATSGSTALNVGEIKYVALSKAAFLESAKAVNEHLLSDSSDIWINPLPSFHVGGLGIWARAYLSGAKVVPYTEKWDPKHYLELMSQNKGTFSSLVPTQVYDLVQQRLHAPASLKGIVVGGGSLEESLYASANSLGWKLLPSYGLTEASSQVATANYVNKKSISNALQILPHVSVKIDSEGFINLAGTSLFNCYAYIRNEKCELIDPKREGWFKTEDKGLIEKGYLTVLGRESDFVKIGGESVDMLRLEKILQKIKLEVDVSNDIALIAVPEPRLGHVIQLVTDGEIDASLKKLLGLYDSQVHPFERVRKVHRLETIPRSPLKKLLRKQLMSLLLDVMD